MGSLSIAEICNENHDSGMEWTKRRDDRKGSETAEQDGRSRSSSALTAFSFPSLLYPSPTPQKGFQLERSHSAGRGSAAVATQQGTWAR